MNSEDKFSQTANRYQYPQKLRILYVTNSDGIGGGAAFAVYALMLDLKKRYNVEPTLLAKSESVFTDLCRKNGIEVIVQSYYPWISEEFSWLHKLKLAAKKLLNRVLFVKQKMFRLLHGRHFDIVHTNSSITEYGDIIAQHLSIPHVQHIRESGWWYYSYPENYVRTVYARAAANIVISQSNYDVYVNQRKLCKPDNTRLIYNGIQISAPYSKHTPDPEHIHFCMTGNFQLGKNQLIAVKACEKLKALTQNFTIHFVGEQHNLYGQEVKRFVSSHGLGEYIKFHGMRWNVGEILKNMDVGLMLSTREAFGRVTVEYMLHYMPVIGVNTGATPEIVIDGETGYLFDLDDTDRLVELMHKFITNPEIIPAMGNKGRERAVKHYSLERNTDEIYALYQEILKVHPPR